jgi:hypothetical protein
MVQAFSFSRRMISPELCQASAKNERQNPDLRQKAPAVDPAAVTIMFCKPRKKEIN